MTSAKLFVDLHKPYRKKYITRHTSEGELFTGTAWSHRNDFLSDYLINEAIEGVLTLGYFASTITQLVGVDIDNHRNYSEGWLLNIYGQVVERFGVYPSVLVRTPRGLHAFWYLTQPYSTEIIKDYTKERLEGLLDFIDIRPDVNNALRIPVEDNLLDPETLEPLRQPARLVMQSAEQYNAITLFFQEWQQQLPTETQQNKRRKVALFRHGEKITSGEQRIAPFGFISGKTNGQFLDLALLYRTNGLDLEAAYERMLMLLERSYRYTGDLRKRLRVRLEWEYNNNQYTPKPVETQPTLFDQQIIDYAVAKSPFAYQRDEAIRRFVKELLKWRNYQDEIMKNPSEMAVWNYYYRYYWKNRKEGYYPLPHSLLKQWNKRYNDLLPFIIELGVLKPSPYGYSASSNGTGVSKYYGIIQGEPPSES